MLYISKEYPSGECVVTNTLEGYSQSFTHDEIVEKVNSGVKIYGVSNNFKIHSYNSVEGFVNQFSVRAKLSGLPYELAVKHIGGGIDWILYDRGEMEHLVIPDFVDMICENALNFSDIVKSVHIPESVQCVQDYAFGHCYHLTKLTGCTGLRFIRYSSFCSTPLTELPEMPKLEEIAKAAFDNTHIREFHFKCKDLRWNNSAGVETEVLDFEHVDALWLSQGLGSFPALRELRLPKRVFSQQNYGCHTNFWDLDAKWMYPSLKEVWAYRNKDAEAIAKRMYRYTMGHAKVHYYEDYKR